jgi:hypothetical protein
MGSMSEYPDREHVAADEQRIAELLRAVEAPAPGVLHQRIAALNDGSRARRRRLRAPALGFSGAFAAAAATLVIVLVAGTGSAAPSALAASRLALARSTGPAPATLVAAGTTIRFPQWADRGWPSAGTRRDTLGGRTVTTEFYRSYDARSTLGYAIVSGSPLKWGAPGHVLVRRGGEYRVISSGGAQIVTWVQDGHTCVIASRTASPATLVRLAVAQDNGSPV